MKYIKQYESYYDLIKPFLIEKYVVVKSHNNKDHYLIEIKEEMRGTQVLANKLYTIRPDNTIKKNKHQYYGIDLDKLKDTYIYRSSYIKDAYDVLKSVNDANKYNL